MAITIKESTRWEQMAITVMKREVIALEKWRTKGIEVEKKHLNGTNDIVDNHNKIRLIAALLVLMKMIVT